MSSSFGWPAGTRRQMVLEALPTAYPCSHARRGATRTLPVRGKVLHGSHHWQLGASRRREQGEPGRRPMRRHVQGTLSLSLRERTCRCTRNHLRVSRAGVVALAKDSAFRLRDARLRLHMKPPSQPHLSTQHCQLLKAALSQGRGSRQARRHVWGRPGPMADDMSSGKVVSIAECYLSQL